GQLVHRPESLVAQEGDVSTITWTYTGAYQTFQWYQQVPQNRLGPPVTVNARDTVTDGRFMGEHLEDLESSSRHSSDAQPGGLRPLLVLGGAQRPKLGSV
ncbi:hypothetical protein G0U57_001745, partial [Chelydra serpentina]